MIGYAGQGGLDLSTFSNPLANYNVNENSDDATSGDVKGDVVKVVTRTNLANTSSSIQTNYYNKNMQLMSMAPSSRTQGRITKLIQQ